MSGAEEKGLLGKLPSRRPGVASPRRAEAREAAARRAEAEPGLDDPSGQDSGETGSGGIVSGVGQLARSGVGVASGAASVGLKLAGRAIGEIGRVVVRRP